MSTNARLMRASGYLAAFLPGAAIFFSSRVTLLHRTPLAISFVLICAVARTFGPGPSILAPILTAVCFNYVVALPEYGWALSSQGFVETSITLGLGFAMAYLFQSQQKAERSLRSANAALLDRTNALIQAQQGSNSAAWAFDTKTRRTSWYEGGSELFGRSLAEITAMGSPTNLVLEEDRPRVASAAARTVQTGQPFQVQFRVVWPNGEVRWLEACGSPQRSDPSLWLGVTTDITNRKTAELALIRSEKLSATSRLASSVSHEINNPLEALTNLIYLAKSKAVNPETRAFLEDAEHEIARIAHITSQSLRFHQQQTHPAEADVAELLRAIMLFYQPRLAMAGISVKFDEHESSTVLCRGNEIRQVFGNLIQNALESMPSGGFMRLRVRTCTDWRSSSPAVRITIADTGGGMSVQTKKRIYEPFFTTKDGTNTGLGLWVSAGIIERHGGRIQVWSSTDPGRSGAVFCVVLPLQLPPLSGTTRLSSPDQSLLADESAQPTN